MLIEATDSDDGPIRVTVLDRGCFVKMISVLDEDDDVDSADALDDVLLDD